MPTILERAVAARDERKESAIRLANEYKELEIRINLAGPLERREILRRVAEIAHEMSDLGYSLTDLIRKRQKRERL